MRSILQRSAALGLAGGVMLSCVLVGATRVGAFPEQSANLKQAATPNRPARPGTTTPNRPANSNQPAGPNRPGNASQAAAPRQEVFMSLVHVPVFVLANAEGSPVTFTQGEGQAAQEFVSVFMIRADAQQALEGLRRSNPQLANAVRVTPIPLAAIYYEALRPAAENNNVAFDLVPIMPEVEAARQILQRSGQNPQNFREIPLFYITRASGENSGAPITIRRDDRAITPFYFRRQEAQDELNVLVQRQPNLNNQLEVRFTGLSTVLEHLQASSTQELTQQGVLIMPPRDSAEDTRALIQNLQQQSQSQQNRPGQNQAPTRPNQPQQPAPVRPAQPAQPARP